MENQDPFADHSFAPLDLRGGPEGPLVDQLSRIAEENPELVPGLEQEPETQQAPTTPTAPAVPKKTAPEITKLPDGSVVTIEHTNRGWKATLQGSGQQSPEVFYGATKDEMYQNVMVGKLKATQQIRKLNRELKLGTAQKTNPQTVTNVGAKTKGRVLTADEEFQLKTELAANPGLAIEGWFQKRFGMTADELNERLDKGEKADSQLNIETVCREFLSTNPGYYRDPRNENYYNLVGVLSKKHLGKSISPQTFSKLGDELYDEGFWTVENLTDAFEEMVDAGLHLPEPEAREEVTPAPEVEEPSEPPAPPAPAEPQAAPAKGASPNNERIVRTVRRPRAGLGISSRETTTAPKTNESDKPPSAEEIEQLSDAQVSDLMAGVRRAAVARRR